MSLHRHSVKSLLIQGRDRLGTQVSISGWVKSKRDTKSGMSFVDLIDGSSFKPLQVIIPKDLDNHKDILKLTTHCSIKVCGGIVESPAKGQDIELVAKSVEIFGMVEDPLTYPIQPKEHSPEFLRSVAHLRPRTMKFGSVSPSRKHLIAP